MNAKKLLSTGLAMALTLSLSLPALASSGTAEITTPNATTKAYSSETEISGTTEVPTIKITVPTTGGVVINPYRMEVNMTSSGGGAKDKDQILSAVQAIANESNVAIKVNATVTGEAPGESKAVFATAPLKGTETTKSVFLYLEVIAGDKVTYDKSNSKFTKTEWADAYDAKATNMVPVSGGNKSTTKAGVATIAAKGASDPSYAAFRLSGTAATAPTEAWTTTDKVNVTIEIGRAHV